MLWLCKTTTIEGVWVEFGFLVLKCTNRGTCYSHDPMVMNRGFGLIHGDHFYCMSETYNASFMAFSVWWITWNVIFVHFEFLQLPLRKYTMRGKISAHFSRYNQLEGHLFCFKKSNLSLWTSGSFQIICG